MHRSALSYADALAQAEEILAARRARHGDARMDVTEGGAPEGGAPEGTPPPAEDTRTEAEKLAELEAKFEELKSNSRKWEDRAKANKKDAEAWRAAQDADATPDQKLTAAEERAQQAERELSRYKVAAETGIPADLLAGDDEDAMREHAERLKAFKGTTPTAPVAPKPDPSQGGKGGTKPSAADEGRAEAARRFKKN